MAKQIFSLDHLTEVQQIEAPQRSRPSIGHTQAKPQPQQRTDSLCMSCVNQMNEDYSICDNGIVEGGAVGMRFCVWACRAYEAKTA